MNSSSLHTWEVEEYSCPCKRLTDKRRHRIRGDSDQAQSLKSNYMPKQLWEEVSKWQIWGLNLCQPPQDQIFLCCDGMDQKNPIIYKSYSHRYLCTHALRPPETGIDSDMAAADLSCHLCCQSSSNQTFFSFPPGTRKGTPLSTAKNLFSVFLHLLITIFGKMLHFLGER